MKNTLQRLIGDCRGATAIEYGLIAALIFLVIVVSVNTFAGSMTNLFNNISNAISGSL